jgi:hypothetical protein
MSDPPITPNSVTNLQLVYNSPTSATLTWDWAPGTITGISPEFGMPSTITAAENNTYFMGFYITAFYSFVETNKNLASGKQTNKNLRSYTFNNLVAGRYYVFSVLVEGAYGYLSNQSINGFRVPDSPLIYSTVSGLYSITFSWYPPNSNGGSAISKYQVSLNNYVTAIDVSSALTSYTYSNLLGGQSYTLRVRAVSNVGPSVPDRINATPDMLTLSAPTGLILTPTSSSACSLQWNTVQDASSYQITLYSDPLYTVPVQAPQIKYTTSAAFTGLSTNTVHYGEVVARAYQFNDSPPTQGSLTTYDVFDVSVNSMTSTSITYTLSRVGISVLPTSVIVSQGTAVVDNTILTISNLSGGTLYNTITISADNYDTYTLPAARTNYTYTPTLATTTSTSATFTLTPDNSFPLPTAVSASFGSASLSGSTLTITGLTRGTTYSISVSATGYDTSTLPTFTTISAFTATIVSTSGTSITYTLSPVGGSVLPSEVATSAGTPTLLNGNTTLVVSGLFDTTVYNNIIVSTTGYESYTLPEATTSVITGEIPCFFGSARVLTSTGYRRLDSIAAGDVVLTPDRSNAAINYVRTYTIDAGPATNPYVIPAGTFGAKRRLLISPDHKVCLADGRRVVARDLGLDQEEREGTLRYFNLELEGGADMVVDGVAVESLQYTHRVRMTVQELSAMLRETYGTITPAVLARVQRTCRFLDDGMVEVPVTPPKPQAPVSHSR